MALQSSLFPYTALLNSNIRCIEIFDINENKLELRLLNSNIRCIEICVGAGKTYEMAS